MEVKQSLYQLFQILFQTPLGKKSLLFEPTQAYTGDVEDEDSNQGETEKKSVMYEPTQAYPGNTGPNEVI